ncbi:hypothetical protein QFZ99_005971 [Paraburkholderia atlantica]|uniref:hypothetical protein n=1 Tax=Paraburkholderia atlantica TaxID=2654982 RepID=UPI003D1F5438
MKKVKRSASARRRRPDVYAERILRCSCPEPAACGVDEGVHPQYDPRVLACEFFFPTLSDDTIERLFYHASRQIHYAKGTMLKEDLTYAKLKSLIAKYDEKKRSESASFLNWFFENIYRLNDVDADDAIL